MQPLNETEADQGQRARMQAEQTVMARSRPRRDLRAFCLAPLPRSRPDLIGKDRLIEAAIGQWASTRKGDYGGEISLLDQRSSGRKHGGGKKSVTLAGRE
jgi:hypothetical protein